MSFVYHRVPNDFEGSIIYPLNKLKDKYPAIYQARVEKYSWRMDVMQQPVHPLHCLWNDCVFMMAAHPAEVKRELYSLGYAGKFPTKFWQIEADRLEPENTTIYNFEHLQRPHPAEDFLPYNPNNLKHTAVVPDRTIEYWKKCLSEPDARLLLYMFIPHIMYKGMIDVLTTEIIEV